MVSAISLPSIHEGFPNIDFGEPAAPRFQPPPLDLVVRTVFDHPPRQLTPAQTRRAPSRAKTSPYPAARPAPSPYTSSSAERVITLTPVYVTSPPKQRPRSPVRYAAPPAHAQPAKPHYQPQAPREYHPQPPPQHDYPAHASSSRTLSSASSSSSTASARSSPPTSPPQPQTHSFDVLRADPSGRLEHIGSSRLPAPAPPAPAPQKRGVANGSVPAFRVSLGGPAPTPAPPAPRRTTTTFPAHPPPTHAGLAKFARDPPSTGGGGRDARGKKHQCPQCPKRFNRPSSLRIHVNTHTGARPFACPHPRCGREFNVNSNMRRHFRNHALPGGAGVYPPRQSSGRRPEGYVRPHPAGSEGTGSGDVSDAEMLEGEYDGEDASEGEESDGTVASLDVYAPPHPPHDALKYYHPYTLQEMPHRGYEHSPSLSPSPSPSPPPYGYAHAHARYPSSADRYDTVPRAVSTVLRPAFR
ncbi:hypothetical protein HWV62_31835 [Athelia sp. TMB]|nr:hypothetical protein HWV62_31835 [Athelia sp. TMB]